MALKGKFGQDFSDEYINSLKEHNTIYYDQPSTTFTCNLPNGNYAGKWSGYNLNIDKKDYKTKEGIRTTRPEDVLAVVKNKNGKIYCKKPNEKT